MEYSHGLSTFDSIIKRSFDIVMSTAGVGVTFGVIGIAYLVARLDTGKSGFFTQERVGKSGRLFKVIKIRTMRELPDITTTVTTANNPRITAVGRFLRKTKIDELPQLINVLKGDMSFVGPRPDVPGFLDTLTGEDRVVLSVRPGITGPATLKYRHEEELLASQHDPERYNREVIFPDKVRINREYIRNYSFKRDLYYIFKTIFDRL